LKPESVSTKQERIAELARKNPAMAFTSLNHYLDEEWLRCAYECRRKDGAVGVDGQTAQDYALNLEQNLRDLLGRLKSGRYRAPPVRCAYIAKLDGGQRGLGSPTFEDKVAQRAVVMLLEPIYEQTFLDCSYGSRPQRNAHQALDALRGGIMGRMEQWVLEVDVRKCYDSIPKAKLRECLSRRVTDGVVRRLIDKWLKAGVLEEGTIHYPTTGTPQGCVISSVLSNVFLHYAVDEWLVKEVQPRLWGESILTRYCDDFVVSFELKEDAERVQAVLGKRLGRFGLQLDFRPERLPREEKDTTHTSFDYLGFTHVWGRSRQGRWVLRQLTAKTRLARALKVISFRCRQMMHWPLAEQHRRLSRLMQGHFAYFGIAGNSENLNRLRHHARRIWRKWLSRRSWKSYINWEKFVRMLESYPLPRPRIMHGYDYRWANLCNEEPSARIAFARVCEGRGP
jgi:RNA-directed DNA polymerase